ncbi:helix-turn-helix transcriptional regulator [Enterococcus hulanensis]|uniref:AraC family transcriptional regulator n=1 Tax=Enterococcus hulanensis TaxID=2559929 RepID=UPI001A8FAA54|nr:AraC family transcriptional regulator [Enterococcus hulanensis]MBO0458179.1 helix-turn-helix transcriptional regulator [Enterococcus hulanensis]
MMLYEIDLNKPIFFLWGGLFENKKDHSWRHKRTEHSENFEAIIPIKNDLELNINDEDVLIKENHFYLVPPNATIRSSSRVDHELSFYWFHFISSYKIVTQDDEKLKQGLQEIGSLESNTSLNNSVILPTYFVLHHPEKISILINQLLNNEKIYQYTQRSNDFFLILLLISISDDYLKYLSRNSKIKVKKTALIAEWIRVNISGDLNLITIANQFGLNPNYLSRIFKKEQGLGIKEYILTIKLDYAKRMLTTTNLSINEIAEQAFFYDAKHFMRLFKQKNGITPSQYREENSHTNLNSSMMDPSSPLPRQFGNEGLKKLLFEIIKENKRQ